MTRLSSVAVGPMTVLALAAIAAVSGCSAAPARADTAAACNVARTQLLAIGALVETATPADSADRDQALAVATAGQITTHTDRLANALRNSEVAPAFDGVQASLTSFAETVSVEDSSAHDIAAARRDLDTSGADLIAVCAATTAIGDTGTGGATKLATGAGVASTGGDAGSVTLDPALQPGQSLSGTISDDASGQRGTWTIDLATTEASLLKPWSWGSHFVLTLTTSLQAEFVFFDETGDDYTIEVNRTGVSHDVYYSSARPAITRFHLGQGVDGF